MSSYLAPADYVLWILALGLNVAVFVQMVRHGAASTIRALYAYVCFNILRTICLIYISQASTYSAYSRTYWQLKNIEYTLATILAIELLGALPRRRIVRKILVVSLASLVYICLTSNIALTPFSGSQVAAAFRCAAFIMAMAVGGSQCWPHRGISAGFGFAAALELAVAILQSHFQWQGWEAIRRLFPVASLVGLAAWVYTLTPAKQSNLQAHKHLTASMSIELNCQLSAMEGVQL